MLLCRQYVLLITRLGLILNLAVFFASSSVNPRSSSSSTRRKTSGGASVDGEVKNIFHSGCLNAIHERRQRVSSSNEESDGETEEEYSNECGNKEALKRIRMSKRICNSDDQLNGNDGDCGQPIFDNYSEVTIAPGDWDESLVLGWIYQIVLSEVLGVPTTVHGNAPSKLGEAAFSFYDPQARYTYPAATYPMHALVEADKVNGDCSKSKSFCAHILPSAWQGGRLAARKYEEHVYSLEQRNGIHVRLGFHIPKYTAERYPSLVSYYGLQGEKNREKLAQIFKTPLRWNEYCSLDYADCENGDDVAVSYPNTTEEGESFFIQDKYIGHFYLAESNNCTLNRNTCTGHVVTPTCTYTNFAEAQLYWNEIHLKSNGKLTPNHGYKTKYMKQIYTAANATRSDVMLWWWTPDQLDQTYLGQDFELVRVAFPRPNTKCLNFRRKGGLERCSEKFEDRAGSVADGSCDYPKEIPSKVLSKGLERATLVNEEEAIQSPALDFLHDIILPMNTVDNIFFHWEVLRKKGVDNFERESVCNWVYHNLDCLMRYVPRNFPRTRKVVEFNVFTVLGSIFGGITLLVVVISFCLIIKWKSRRFIRFAQIDALLMTAVGYGFMAMGGIVGSIGPSSVSCALTQWFTRMGYTLALVPTLIKLSTIHSLMRAGEHFQRADIDKHKFKKVMATTWIILVLYLTIWTIFDIPSPKKNYYESRDGENTMVTVNEYTGCASRSDWWEIFSVAFEGMILVATTILTYFCRSAIEELNESRSLSFVVYSHFLFLIMRLLMFSLMSSEILTNALYIRIVSLLITSDTLVAVCVYFFPKFYMVVTTSKFFQKGLSWRNDIHLKHRGNRKTTSTSSNSRYRTINGIRMPEDGVPNLIIKKKNNNAEEDNRMRSSLGLGQTDDVSNIENLQGNTGNPDHSPLQLETNH